MSERLVIAERLKRNIPFELQVLTQWVVWRLLGDGPKPKKVPYCALPHRSGKASVDDPSTWATFPQAINAYLEYPTFRGIGFVLTADDPYCCIDLDGCLIDGRFSELASDLLAETCGSYYEVSQSGTGLHIFVRARMQGRGLKRPEIECYDRERFIAMTGDRYGR